MSLVHLLWEAPIRHTFMPFTENNFSFPDYGQWKKKCFATGGSMLFFTHQYIIFVGPVHEIFIQNGQMHAVGLQLFLVYKC